MADLEHRASLRVAESEPGLADVQTRARLFVSPIMPMTVGLRAPYFAAVDRAVGVAHVADLRSPHRAVRRRLDQGAWPAGPLLYAAVVVFASLRASAQDVVHLFLPAVHDSPDPEPRGFSRKGPTKYGEQSSCSRSPSWLPPWSLHRMQDSLQGSSALPMRRAATAL